MWQWLDKRRCKRIMWYWSTGFQNLEKMWWTWCSGFNGIIFRVVISDASKMCVISSSNRQWFEVTPENTDTFVNRVASNLRTCTSRKKINLILLSQMFRKKMNGSYSLYLINIFSALSLKTRRMHATGSFPYFFCEEYSCFLCVQYLTLPLQTKCNLYHKLSLTLLIMFCLPERHPFFSSQNSMSFTFWIFMCRGSKSTPKCFKRKRSWFMREKVALCSHNAFSGKLEGGKYASGGQRETEQYPMFSN